MRFEDMGKLAVRSIHAKIARDFWNAHPELARELGAIEAAQHEADMAHEVACPQQEAGVHGDQRDLKPEYIERWQCKLCLGTGRVTLGRIVGAGRLRKATTA